MAIFDIIMEQILLSILNVGYRKIETELYGFCLENMETTYTLLNCLKKIIYKI